ncbi:MAG TPA: GspH/FimT family pseudopilin [Usitatibacter sp.]|nr:GspH/FimT family pseudopilin [Usitatibacter sp.]
MRTIGPPPARGRPGSGQRQIGPPPARGRPGSGKRQVGFTLLEIIIVLAIGAMAYAMILGIPFRGASTADLKAAARTLASGLRQAQTMAITTRRDASLTLDMDAREYTLPGETEARHLPKGIDLKLYTAQSEVSSEKRGGIRFYPDGSSTGGRITVSVGERKYLVDVDWLTGRVSIGD